jgi:subtilisin family serine protease
VDIGRRVGIGVAVLGLVLGTAQAANAASPSRGIGSTVTLITGDQVVMHDGTVSSIRPAEGREKVAFSTFTADGHVYVMPTDARRLVATGQLDQRLFDLTTLVEFGYDDAHRDTVPLIVTHPQGRAAPRIANTAVSRELPSINGVAMAADKTTAAWDALTTGGTLRTAGVSKVWLDGKRKSTLDRSAGQIGAPTAWEAGLTGAGVKVAVLDTGVDQTHPDLADREIAEANFSEAPDNVDNFGHGTHVASIMAGTGAKSGGRYRGIAHGAAILDGKVLDDSGYGTDSGVIAGMEWAAQQGADIANLSLGGMDTPEADPLEQAVETLTAQYGTLFVIAAGNEEPGLDRVTSPGSAPSALTVGAVDRDDTLADFSLTGPTARDEAVKPDVTAPGVGIVAALHSAGTINEPVEDGYTALSGTSMATPHVAGAAALIAQQHPDWTGQQLKSALTASAKPTSGLTPFEQGAGRVDVTRALNQSVVPEPASISFGVVAWPHDDDQPVTKTLTYRNLGTTDVTLDLAVDGPVFSLSTNQITVPAGDTATVNVIGDTKLATTDGAHAGTVVATSGDTVTRTPVAITRDAEKYDLTLNYTNGNGQPESTAYPRVVNLDDGSLTFLHDDDGSTTVRLPKGRYLVEGIVFSESSEHQNMIVQPGIMLDRDQTFDIDTSVAKPINVTPPAPATLGLASIGYQVATEGVGADGGMTLFDLGALSTAQVGEPLPGTEMTGSVHTDWKGAAGERFGLAWFPDRFPTGYTKAVGWGELATVHEEFGPGAEGDKGIMFLLPLPSSGTMGTSTAGYETALPGSQTMYVTTEGVRWRTELWLTPDFVPEAQFYSPARSYEPGRTYHERYNFPMFGPGLPEGGSQWGTPWVYRVGDDIQAIVPMFTDSSGNAGIVPIRFGTGSTKLYLGDQLIGESPVGGTGFFAGLPAAAGEYRLTMEANPVGRFAPTKWVSAEWTFASSRVDSMTALDLNVVRFQPKLTADGSAPAGEQFRIPVRVQDETGATVRPSKLTVEASYDEGKTWQRVPLTSNQVAKLNHPAGATSVSLRACATDRDGNTVKQTIISAYTLREAKTH